MKIRGNSGKSSGGREEEASLSEADRLLSAGRWEAAQALYAEVLKKEPKASSAHFGLGTIAFHQGRYAEAEKHLRQVEPGAPGSEALSKMMALLWFELAPLPDLMAAEKRLAGDPHDNAAHLARGLAYAKGRQYEPALAELLLALEADPGARGGEARKAFLRIIEIVGRESEIGRRFLLRLSMILFP